MKYVRRTKHDGSAERLYGVWSAMIQRCCNPAHSAYPTHGGRGIVVCDEWKEYPNFRSWAVSLRGDQGRMAVVRVDLNGPYSPENCRIVPEAELAWLIRAFGEVKTPGEWASDRRCVVTSATTLRARVRRGWDHVEAVTIPVRGYSGGGPRIARVRDNAGTTRGSRRAAVDVTLRNPTGGEVTPAQARLRAYVNERYNGRDAATFNRLNMQMPPRGGGRSGGQPTSNPDTRHLVQVRDPATGSPISIRNAHSGNMEYLFYDPVATQFVYMGHLGVRTVPERMVRTMLSSRLAEAMNLATSTSPFFLPTEAVGILSDRIDVESTNPFRCIRDVSYEASQPIDWIHPKVLSHAHEVDGNGRTVYRIRYLLTRTQFDELQAAFASRRAPVMDARNTRANDMNEEVLRRSISEVGRIIGDAAGQVGTEMGTRMADAVRRATDI